MKIPKYIVIRLDTKNHGTTVTATDISDRCEVIEYEAEQTEPMKTTDYCDVCNHKGCDNCIADGSNPYCVPSQFEPKDEPQTDCSWK